MRRTTLTAAVLLIAQAATAQPLNEAYIAGQARTARRILVVDEGRHSAGVGEGVITAIVEAGFGATPLQRVVGADTYTPLAGAALAVLPADSDIVAAADNLEPSR